MNYCSHGYLMLTCPRCTRGTGDTPFGVALPRPPGPDQLTIDLNAVIERAAQRVAGSTRLQQTYRAPVVDDPALD